MTNYPSHVDFRDTLSPSHCSTSTVQTQTASEDDAEEETTSTVQTQPGSEDDAEGETDNDDYESSGEEGKDNDEVNGYENQWSDESDTEESLHEEISQSGQLDEDWPPQGLFDFQSFICIIVLVLIGVDQCLTRS